MRAMVHFVETTECFVLRASSQAFESVGEYASIMECANVYPPGDKDILLMGERADVARLTESLDRIVEMGPNGERTYFYISFNDRVIKALGKFASYADAVKEAQRRLILPSNGMVFDFEKSRLWSLQLAQAQGSKN